MRFLTFIFVALVGFLPVNAQFRTNIGSAVGSSPEWRTPEIIKDLAGSPLHTGQVPKPWLVNVLTPCEVSSTETKALRFGVPGKEAVAIHSLACPNQANLRIMRLEGNFLHQILNTNVKDVLVITSIRGQSLFFKAADDENYRSGSVVLKKGVFVSKLVP